MAFVVTILPVRLLGRRLSSDHIHRRLAFRLVPHAKITPPAPETSSQHTLNLSLDAHHHISSRYVLLPLSVFSFLISYIALPPLSPLVSQYAPSTALITGAFMPITGILFATFATTAVSVLHNRQINLRSALTTELANISLLQSILSDSNLRQMLRQYLDSLRLETFSNSRQPPQSRRTAFEISDDILWTTLRRANEYRLRSEVELLLHSLVTLRARRRALVDAVLPPVHFLITALLGFCLLLGFVLLVPHPSPASQALFGLMASLLALCFWLLADLQGEWGGQYRVDDFWMEHTQRFLDQEEGELQSITAPSRSTDQLDKH